MAPQLASPNDVYGRFRHECSTLISTFIGLCTLIFLSSILNLESWELQYAAPLAQQAQMAIAHRDTSFSSTSAALPSSTAVLDVFQVAVPVLGPSGIITDSGFTDMASVNTKSASSSCQVTLMEFSFVNSFGKPFVGTYAPPNCIGTANTVIMNFTVASRGVQFDRLAIMYMGDSEVFRTSTAEPKRNGITWQYTKDMSHYMSMWKSSQKVIFDLGNIVTSNLTGIYDTTLTATFFTAPQNVSAADLIIPISARQGVNASAASVFSVPAANASNTISFPRNANRAVFSISSCGQASEEFWWSNVLQSDSSTFVAADGVLAGFSPFREVQVYIDGQLAGVQWPFPVIFTGGVVPGLWSPIVGIDAFDLKEYEIDISPWLPLLCDGEQHMFAIKVAGLTDNGGTSTTISESVGNSWFVSGNIFIWLDDASSVTTGTSPSISLPVPTITISQSLTKNSTGANETLTYTTSVQRSIAISSTVKTQKGSQLCSWTQTLSHSDLAAWLAFGNVQTNNITTAGIDISSGLISYMTTYSYPLFANTSAIVTDDGNVTVSAIIDRTKQIAVSGTSIYPSGLQAFTDDDRSKELVPKFSGTTMETRQNGTATFFSSPRTNTSFTFGSSEQVLRFGGVSGKGALGMDPDTELYFRMVRAVNGTVMRDIERVSGQEMKGSVREVVGSGSFTEQKGFQLIVGGGTGVQKGNLVSGEGVDNPKI